MNILKKTFILFCLAAVSLNTVQPIGVAAANKASRRNRKKGYQKVMIGACITFGLLIFFYKYNSSGATNDESPTPTQNSNQPDASTSGAGKPSNQVSNPGASPTNKPLNGNPNKPDASTSGTGKPSNEVSNPGASPKSKPLNGNPNKPDASTSSNQDQANASSPSPPPPPQQKEILVANYNNYTYLFDIESKRMLKFDRENNITKLSSDGSRILIAYEESSEDKISIINSTTRTEERTMQVRKGVQYISCHPKNRDKFIAANKDTIISFDMTNSGTPPKFKITENDIQKLRFSPDGQYILGNTIFGIFIYDIENEKLLYTNDNIPAVDIQWDSNQEYVAIAVSGKVQIYQFKIPDNESNDKDTILKLVKETGKLPSDPSSVSWSHDNQHLTIATQDNLYIAKWTPPQDNQEATLEVNKFYQAKNKNRLYNATWSSDSKQVVITDGLQIFICSDPLSGYNEKNVSKYKIEGLTTTTSSYFNSLEYGFVKDTSQWDETKLTEIDKSEW